MPRRFSCTIYARLSVCTPCSLSSLSSPRSLTSPVGGRSAWNPSLLQQSTRISPLAPRIADDRRKEDEGYYVDMEKVGFRLEEKRHHSSKLLTRHGQTIEFYTYYLAAHGDRRLFSSLASLWHGDKAKAALRERKSRSIFTFWLQRSSSIFTADIGDSSQQYSSVVSFS